MGSVNANSVYSTALGDIERHLLFCLGRCEDSSRIHNKDSNFGMPSGFISEKV